jgi:hypothetical protein
MLLRMKIARVHRLTLAFSRKLAKLKPLLRCISWTYNLSALIHGI